MPRRQHFMSVIKALSPKSDTGDMPVRHHFMPVIKTLSPESDTGDIYREDNTLCQSFKPWVLSQIQETYAKKTTLYASH